MDLRPTEAQYAAFASAFDFFNTHLFSELLPQPMLTFSRRRMTYGLFVPGLWEGKEDEPVHEIALNPDQLASRSDLEVAGTLVHEMCHEYHELFGTPGRRGYHNAEFARIMEERGPWTTSDGTFDGKRTGQRITHLVMPGGAFERVCTRLPDGMLLPFSCRGSLESAKKTSNRSKIAYVCQETGQKFWAAPGLVVLEARTGEPFVREDDPEETLSVLPPSTLVLVQLLLVLPQEEREKLVASMKE